MCSHQEHDDIWRDKIRAKRFEAFNREWLQLIANSQQQQQLQGASSGGMMLGGGGGHLHNPYDDSGMHHGDSMDDSQEDSMMHHQGGGGGGGGGAGAYGYGHDPMGELGESGGIEHYRHEQSRDSLEDSEEL